MSATREVLLASLSRLSTEDLRAVANAVDATTIYGTGCLTRHPGIGLTCVDPRRVLIRDDPGATT